MAALTIALCSASLAQTGAELRFCLRADPKTFDPLLVDDDNSEAVRYLTGGVLIRFDRVTQKLTPELAESWKLDPAGRRIEFHLRRNVAFSDGTPFSADDVAFTMNRLMDPNTHSPAADPFRSSAVPPKIAVEGPHSVSITFAAPVAGVERLFDQVAILSAHSPNKLAATLGPFVLAEHKPGSEILLRRNPRYWKRGEHGEPLPRLDRIRLSIRQNRDMEILLFLRGELDLINSLDPATFDELAQRSPAAAVDAGVSLDAEMIWFNQVPSAPLPPYKKAWFASTAFRRAISEAINRTDLCRTAYRNHAHPAVGPVSPANRFWFNSALEPHPFDPRSALRRLEQAGFVLRNRELYDAQANRVEFSLMTNAGHKSREAMSAMIRQDLEAIGIRVNLVSLDFPSIIERITRSYQYEACLLGLTNIDLDPSAVMNVWLSSAANHQWNPSQKAPATPWEAEIDRLMQAQAAEPRAAVRKRHFDRVQQVAWEQEPFIYLVNPDSLMAISPTLRNSAPSVLQPHAFWNIDVLEKPAAASPQGTRP